MKKLITAIAAAILLSTSPAVSQTARPKCGATTLAGTPCSRYAIGTTGYCNQHNPAAHRCGATTKAGTPCKFVVKTAGTHCKRHTK